MTYLPDLHSYLHHSSLLIQAYPTTRITTKYSLPRKEPPKPKPTPASANPSREPREKREPSATLTLKTYHPESGICLKYRTDKAAEVGRLMSGLGKLAKGEVVEMPSAAAVAAAASAEGGDKMDIDGGDGLEEKVGSTPAVNTTAGAGGAKKKKKGKGGK